MSERSERINVIGPVTSGAPSLRGVQKGQRP
jgi:hypothetical protein